MNAVGAPVLPIRHASVLVQFQNCAANRSMPFRVCIENREARLAGEPLSQILKRLGKYFSSDISCTPITQKDERKAERDGRTISFVPQF